MKAPYYIHFDRFNQVGRQWFDELVRLGVAVQIEEPTKYYERQKKIDRLRRQIISTSEKELSWRLNRELEELEE